MGGSRVSLYAGLFLSVSYICTFSISCWNTFEPDGVASEFVRVGLTMSPPRSMKLIRRPPHPREASLSTTESWVRCSVVLLRSALVD